MGQGGSLDVKQADTNPAEAQTLHLDVYVGSVDSFGVTSTLIYGPTEAILIDTQYHISEASKLADRIAATGRRLKAVFITHPDEDHYIGSAVIHERFPETPIYMTADALAHFDATSSRELAGAKEYAPSEIPDSVPRPEVLPDTKLTVDGEVIEIIPNLQGDVLKCTNSFVVVPSLRAVIAGDIVFNGVHVYLADSNRESRREWMKSIDRVASFNPSTVVAGHKRSPDMSDTVAALEFTRDYLVRFEGARDQASSAHELIAAMKAKFPEAAFEYLLQVSAESALPVRSNKTTTPATEPVIPVPSGRFAIGRVIYDWTDPARTESLSEKPGAHREVLVTIWYPAVKAVHSKDPAPYFPDFTKARALISEDDFKGMFGPAAEQVEKKGLPLTHSFTGVAMPTDQTQYPVLIFSHGWGLEASLYTAALEELASNGYIVAAVDHPYDTTITIFPDGHFTRFAQGGSANYASAAQRVEVMAADVHFVIDQLSRYGAEPQLGAPFAKHLDVRRIGALGHSIGGLASGRACQIDSRIRACIDEDSLIEGSPFVKVTAGSVLQQPFLLFVGPVADIFSFKKLHPSDEGLQRMKLSRSEYVEIIHRQQTKQEEQLAQIQGGAYRVLAFALPGFTHMSFTDLPLLAASGDAAKSEEARHNFEIVSADTLAFFDKYLKRAEHTALDGEPSDKRVTIQRFGPAAEAAVAPQQ